jgi:hypothetical protein
MPAAPHSRQGGHQHHLSGAAGPEQQLTGLGLGFAAASSSSPSSEHLLYPPHELEGGTPPLGIATVFGAEQEYRAAASGQQQPLPSV